MNNPIQETIGDALQKARIQCDEAEAARKQIAVIASERGVSLRQIGLILGLGHSKVHQIVKDKALDNKPDPLTLPLKEDRI